MHFACTIEYAQSIFTAMNCAPMNSCSRHYHLVIFIIGKREVMGNLYLK